MAVMGIKPAVAFKINEKNDSNSSADFGVSTPVKCGCLEALEILGFESVEGKFSCVEKLWIEKR